MFRPREITLIGAGLVGSLLAVFLARRGFSVRMFEKRPDIRKTVIPAGRSINLALAERGLHALRTAQVFPQVEPLLIPMRGRMLHYLDGRMEFAPYGQRPHEVIYSVSRLKLNQVLLDVAESTGRVQIQFRTACTHVDLDQQRVTFCDATTERTWEEPFDLLLGGDGASSVVRDAIIQRMSGTCLQEPLDHSYKELVIPPNPDGQFQMQADCLHIWPRDGCMLIALPNLDASFTVTLFLATEGRPSFSQLEAEGNVQQFFDTYFPDTHGLIPQLLQDFRENPTGSLGTIRCWPWSFEDRALILGDAAHAIVPFHGQGMNAGFEDCETLARMLDETGGDWRATIARFPVARKLDTDAIAQMALENYVDMRDNVRRDDFLLRKEVGFELERRCPELFIPRYSLVMFHRVPYADALQRGLIQEQLLDEILQGVRQAHEVDYDRAEHLVRQRLSPLSEE